MKRPTHDSAFVLITILSKNDSDNGLAGDNRAVSALSSHPLNFQTPPPVDVTLSERTQHILYCSQIGLSFEHLNDYPLYHEMEKDDFGFMSPCGPVHGMVRGHGRTIGTMTKHKAKDLAPINF